MACHYIGLHRAFFGTLLSLAAIACGGDDGLPGTGSGVGAGGAMGQGGNGATGGVVTNGQGGQQTVGQGGTSQGEGGAPEQGGSMTGGKATTGGAANQGGMATGGQAATGGASSVGGAATGGRVATGGTVSIGGAATGGKAATGGAVTGGKAATGGAVTGGKAATGGAVTGGKAATGGAATGGATTNSGAGPTVTCGCTTSTGEFSGNNLKSTIVVDAGETYDGGCKTFRADPSSLGPGDQSEGQSPVFQVNGGTLKNVILGASAADGIHTTGNATLNNIHWLDIGEDAMTVKGSGTVTLDCGSSKLGDDKTFQVNASSTITIKNFTARSAGKFMRQNGDTTFKMAVTIDHCDIAGMDECIYRTDSSTSTVTMTNTRYSNIGDSLFIFGSTGYGNQNVSGKITVSGNVAY